MDIEIQRWENLWMRGMRPEVIADDALVYFDSEEFSKRCAWASMNEPLYERLKEWDESKSKGFYIYGRPGVGKTTFIKTKAFALAAQNQRQPDHVKVIHFGRAMKAMTANKFARYDEIMESILSAKHLFIDDIGAEADTDYRESELTDILDYRLLHRKDLRTYFTSNLPPEELRYGPRVERRLLDIALPLSVNW